VTTPTAGILYPGFSAEDDYAVAEQHLGVRLPVVHTQMPEDAHRVDALLEIGAAPVLADGARRVRGRGVRSVLWACTSGSFVFGWDGARQQVAELQQVAGVPASSTSFAFVRAAAALGLRRVAVAATYPADVASRFVQFLQAGGQQVVHWSGRGIITAAEVGTLGRDEVVEFAAANDDALADAVLLPDTALHTLAWLEDLEARLGKPVLTANQVTVWEGLRLAGWECGSEKLGTLFRCAGVGQRAPCP
jgi:maleate cis-trans isomerase